MANGMDHQPSVSTAATQHPRNSRLVRRQLWMLGFPWVQIVGVVGMLILVAATVVNFGRPVAHAATGDWPTYMGNNARTGFNRAETILNPNTASQLKMHWMNSSGSLMATEPIVANGMIYWGTWDGLEHATNPSSGKDVWTAHLGQESGCTAHPHGVLSTATFALVSMKGTTTPVIFVGGGDVQLYALNANTGSVLWKTRLGMPPSFIYSSPLVFNGSIYVGLSSFNDCPEVQGQLVQVNASTGAIQHTFNVVPNGCMGGGIWGSAAIDNATGMLYFATGDLGHCSMTEPLVSAVIAVHASDLSLVGSWQVPGLNLADNFDFGNTPTLFQTKIGGVSHSMLGIINKNGIYYAFDRTRISAGPVWQRQLANPGGSPDTGQGSISSSAWDGANLYVAGAATTMNGKNCPGSLRALNPTNGTIRWETCVGKDVLAGVIAVPGLVVVGAGPNMFVIDAGTGKRLFTFHDTTVGGSSFWAAASISNGMLYDGGTDGNLYAFGL